MIVDERRATCIDGESGLRTSAVPYVLSIKSRPRRDRRDDRVTTSSKHVLGPTIASLSCDWSRSAPRAGRAPTTTATGIIDGRKGDAMTAGCALVSGRGRAMGSCQDLRVRAVKSTCGASCDAPYRPDSNERRRRCVQEESDDIQNESRDPWSLRISATWAYQLTRGKVHILFRRHAMAGSVDAFVDAFKLHSLRLLHLALLHCFARCLHSSSRAPER